MKKEDWVAWAHSLLEEQVEPVDAVAAVEVGLQEVLVYTRFEVLPVLARADMSKGQELHA